MAIETNGNTPNDVQPPNSNVGGGGTPEQDKGTASEGQQTLQQQEQKEQMSASVLKEIPDWLKQKADQKYGGDVQKAIEGLSNAEAKMHEATQRARELEQELELLQSAGSQKSYSQPSDIYSVSAEEKAKIEAEYGMPYEQAMGFFKIAQQAQMPVIEMAAEAKLESLKSNLRQTDPNFTPEVETKFDKLIRAKHPQDRVIPQIINECVRLAKGSSVDDIVAARVQAELKKLAGNPNSPPNVSKPSSGTVSPQDTKEQVPEEEIENLMQFASVSREQALKMLGG